jgi:hypothetical protein
MARHRRNQARLVAEDVQPSKELAVLPKWCFELQLPNLWLGVSAEDQKTPTRVSPSWRRRLCHC